MTDSIKQPSKDNSGNRTSEQMRAEHALKAIRVFRELDQIQNEGAKNAPVYGNLRAYIETLPATIVMNGLGQAFASELAKARIGEGKGAIVDRQHADLKASIEDLLSGTSSRSSDERAHEALYMIIQDWLRECRVCSGKEDLMDALVRGNQNRYVRAQAETLAYLEWLKKFGQAFLRERGRGEGDGN